MQTLRKLQVQLLNEVVHEGDIQVNKGDLMINGLEDFSVEELHYIMKTLSNLVCQYSMQREELEYALSL
jgi:hypothetical protein